jgi:LysR family transcriptional regulator for bpeEF and oprC
VNALRDFNREYPGIEIVLGVTDRTVDLVAEGVDCALRLGDLPDSTLIARPIGMAGMITCASPSYLSERGEPKTVEELSGHHGVVSCQAEQSPTCLAIHRGRERKKIRPSIIGDRE